MSAIAELTAHQLLEKAKVAKPLGLVVLAHHWGGSRHSLLRLRRYYQRLGFDVLSMDFRFHGTNWLTLPLRLRRQWMKDFEDLSQKAKAIASERGYRNIGFHARSSFASVVISVLANNVEIRKDYAWGILECGPFLKGLPAWYRLLRKFYRVPVLLSLGLLPLAYPVWDMSYDKDLRFDLKKLYHSPLPMKYLVLAGAEDELVPIEDLREVSGKLKAQFEVFDGVGHLEILKLSFSRFSSLVNSFLEIKTQNT